MKLICPAAAFGALLGVAALGPALVPGPASSTQDGLGFGANSGPRSGESDRSTVLRGEATAGRSRSLGPLVGHVLSLQAQARPAIRKPPSSWTSCSRTVSVLLPSPRWL